MKFNAYGYEYKNLFQLIRAFIVRQICSLKGHPNIKFHASTCAWKNGDNVDVGITAVCPQCHKSFTGDVKAGFHGPFDDE